MNNRDLNQYKKTMTLVAIILILSSQALISQTPITLKAAIDSAIQNNPFIRNEKLKAEYKKTLIKSANEIPMTNVGMEYGQINSAYSDTRLGLQQDINFPTIYTKQKSVLTEAWRSGLIEVAVRETELKKQVSHAFYTLFYLREKAKLLKKNDSFYSEFLKKSELRFKVGEINLIEKVTAETQQGQIKVQLNQLENDYNIVQVQFQYLLNSNTIFLPYESDLKLNFDANKDTSFLKSHPTIRLLEQQKLLSATNTSLERSRLLPDLTLAYNNMSMIGTGADNKTYTTSYRFQSGQFGVGIPLFYGAQRAKIHAAKINEQVASNNYTIGLNSIHTEYQKALLSYLKYYQTVQYYETTALKNASTILESANEQYNNGEINYLEYVIYTHQAINLQNEYIDAVKDLNESIIELAYLSNTN